MFRVQTKTEPEPTVADILSRATALHEALAELSDIALKVMGPSIKREHIAAAWRALGYALTD